MHFRCHDQCKYVRKLWLTKEMYTKLLIKNEYENLLLHRQSAVKCPMATRCTVATAGTRPIVCYGKYGNGPFAPPEPCKDVVPRGSVAMGSHPQPLPMYRNPDSEERKERAHTSDSKRRSSSRSRRHEKSKERAHSSDSKRKRRSSSRRHEKGSNRRSSSRSRRSRRTYTRSRSLVKV